MRYRLALKFGCSVRELGQRIPSSEWPGWFAFYQMEPWGYHWQNEQQALIRHSVTAMAGNRVKKAPKLREFLTKHGH